MNAIDDSEHYKGTSDEPPPSLLTVIIDTNPRSWTHLSDTLPFKTFIANLMVFINAHLAFSSANEVAILASHIDGASWLYPSPAPRLTSNVPSHRNGDTEMSDVPQPRPAPERRPSIPSDGRKYPPFAAVERQLLSSLQTLLSRAPPATPWHTLETFTAGALTLALSYTNRRILTHSSASGISNPNPDPSASAAPSSSSEKGGPSAALTARILLITLTPLNAGQYIPLMNSLFAAQRLAIKVDVLHLFGRPSPFLQQLCHATAGIYLSLAPASPPSSPSPNGSTGAGAHADTGIPGGDASPGPRGLLQYLFTLFLPDATARKHLRAPQQAEVDFRAACFCHRRVVDVGFVCSVCLSIFCEVPPGEERGYSECLICGSRLVVKEGLGAGL